MNGLRWSPNIMFDNGNIDNFWCEHFSKPDRKVLFVMGKGFDVRMNFTLSRLLLRCPDVKLKCLLIEFDEGISSSSHKYRSFVEENMQEFENLLSSEKIDKRCISTGSSNGSGSRSIGDRKAAGIIRDHSDIEGYTDIIVDISSMPRGLYFSLIGKILTIIDSNPGKDHNLFLSVAENVNIDALIQESEIQEDLTYLHGFGGGVELQSESEKPLIWFPILGEKRESHITKGADRIMEDKNRLFEICPVLPFPSKNPRRSDSLLMDYHDLLFDSLKIEPQNIMYMTERDPFQAYVQLSNAICNYRDSLDIIKGCKIALSNFSSKLISIGTLLVAYENQDFVGILNVNAGGYTILDETLMKTYRNDSELFVTWLTGIPYLR